MEDAPIASTLDRDPRRVAVVLFSLPGCPYCREVREHYLKPLIASRRPGVSVAEVSVELRDVMRDWQGREVRQNDFARAHGARYTPTVMFFDAHGKPLAEPIVGLSRDFFGSYLEQRIATALRALGTAPGG